MNNWKKSKQNRTQKQLIDTTDIQFYCDYYYTILFN